MLWKMLTFLSLNCREKKIEGLTSLRVMAQNHMDILMPKLHDICLAIINEVKNLRSAVSCAAMATLGDMYVHLQRAMDSEVEGTAPQSQRGQRLHPAGAPTLPWVTWCRAAPLPVS
ncbi:TOG array regulator of axonemal microtubules protein 2-like [Oncorhynchus keta]|uniref:TOG array regulator of axonemal microtubules protein 2-like n=1 Tax=Oncorhynchus keta TaxID=8018 RepID=UPI00227BA51E|nr:TOG array regulator of axonemal microtubules protein 2-like [Oncorhynchus keta]